MVDSVQIIGKLNTVDQFKFAALVDNLVYQGAFLELAQKGSSVESFGLNMEKERTIRSAPFSDSEIRSAGIFIESSVRVDWNNKLKKEVKKHKGEEIKFFAFFSNQDVGTKQVSFRGRNETAEEYIEAELGCEQAFVFGQKDFATRLQNPDFFYLRRNYLGIKEDLFLSGEQYKALLAENNSLNCSTPTEDLEKFSDELITELIMNPAQVVVLHNDDYITLLHTVSLWAEKKSKTINDPIIQEDYCFIDWPHEKRDSTAIDKTEINREVKSFVVIWGAQSIENLSEYLRLNIDNSMLVFVCGTGFKDKVIERLNSFGGSTAVSEISLRSIDERIVPPSEMSEHENKIAKMIANTTELLMQYEALVYLYSPFYVNSDDSLAKLCSILNISQDQEGQLREMLVGNNLAGITGDILWLQHPSVGKELLNRYINDGIFDLNQLP